MPYFKKDDVLLIHIPKTGGTSVTEYFRNRDKNLPSGFLGKFNEQVLYSQDVFKCRAKYGIDHNLQHCTYRELCNILGSEELSKCKTVMAAVRNPYNRAISATFFHNLVKNWNACSNDSDRYDAIYRGLCSFIDAETEESKFDNHRRPQFEYLTISHESDELADNVKILKTESLKADMHALGYTDFNRVSNKNKLKVESYDKYIREEIKDVIAEYYKVDFGAFGYELD